jgi:ribosomal protein S18 acetylase RimI-like enzyme
VTEPVRSLRADDADEVAAVAALHRRCFPDYDSSRLGPAFCRRLVRSYAAEDEAWVAVAEGDDGRIVGYLVAAPPSVQRAVNRSLAPWGALASLRTPARVLRRVVGRARRAVASGAATAPATSSEPDGSAGAARATIRVVLVGVDASARGTGLGRALLEDFAARASVLGHALADLSVEVDNHEARRAYGAAGWVELGEEAGVAVRCQLVLPVAGSPPS